MTITGNTEANHLISILSNNQINDNDKIILNFIEEVIDSEMSDLNKVKMVKAISIEISGHSKYQPIQSTVTV